MDKTYFTDLICKSRHGSYNPTYSGSRNKEDIVLGQPQQNVRPYLKIANKKRAGRVAPVVQPLPSKCEALSSSPSTNQNKRLSI
jgi:hypothetical protein